MKLEKVLKIKKWTKTVFNSNEKRVQEYLKLVLPSYKNIKWTEEKFQKFYIDVLNSLPSRYKQKNSIELSGRLKKQIIIDAITEKLDELSESE